MQAFFSRTEAGRELLGRFKDAKGRPDLPKLTVLKMSQRPGDAGYGGAAAVYDESSRTVILSHWHVVRQILAGVPAAEREKLGARLSDSRALAEYLRAHPAQRTAVANRVDVTLFHELTHAWQYRRQSLAVESIRGNAPSGIILAREHEAFFGGNRYFHEKLMCIPGLSRSSRACWPCRPPRASMRSSTPGRRVRRRPRPSMSSSAPSSPASVNRAARNC